MRGISTKEMQKLDSFAIGGLGIPSLILMENAGRGIADLAGEILSEKSGTVLKRSRMRTVPKILVVAGKGNNGGDGLVAARHLFNRGFKVRVLLLAHLKDIKSDPKINYNILTRMKVPIKNIASIKELKQAYEMFRRSDLLIDAIFGIGLKRPVDGLFHAVIQAMNDSKRNILAVDIPSGLNSDTGEVLGIAVRAHVTGTLGAAKRGLFRGQGPNYCGKISVLDISIPSLDRRRSF